MHLREHEDYLSSKDWVRCLGVYEYASTEEWYDNRFGLPCENYFRLDTRYGKKSLPGAAWQCSYTGSEMLLERKWG